MGIVGTSLSLPVGEPWMAHGVCRGRDADDWYPEKKAQQLKPLQLCHSCPVRVECLLYALRHNEVHGIWGATTAVERAAMRRRR